MERGLSSGWPNNIVMAIIPYKHPHLTPKGTN